MMEVADCRGGGWGWGGRRTDAPRAACVPCALPPSRRPVGELGGLSVTLSFGSVRAARRRPGMPMRERVRAASASARASALVQPSRGACGVVKN